MLTRTIFTAVALSSVVFLPAAATARARAGGGVGVLGDSYSDEYQFFAPHRHKARNWVEILAATRGVDFGEFRSSSWGEPRNQGFAYNWAKSGATTSSMIADCQHHGLAAQVAKGEVSACIIFVGGNDFIEALHSPDPKANLTGLGRKASDNVKAACDAILAASPGVKVIVATVPDVRDLPEFREAARLGKLDAAIANLAVAEIEGFNAEIRRLQAANAGRVAIYDFARISRISLVLSPKHVTVAGRKIAREQIGNTADRLFLADSRHLGTVAQGMLAKLLVDCLNKNCGAGIKPLDEKEILKYADSLAETSIASAAKGD